MSTTNPATAAPPPLPLDAERQPARAALDELAADLGADELRVLAFIAGRLRMGARQYGALDLATDRRTWRRERDEEAADLLVYAACEALTRSGPGTER